MHSIRQLSFHYKPSGALSFTTKKAVTPKASPSPEYVKRSRYTKEGLAILQDTMVPGPALRFLKPRKNRSEKTEDSIYQEPARTQKSQTTDNTKADLQLVIEHRIRKAMANLVSMEQLPDHYLTCMTIERVKISRNMKSIRVYYLPTSTQLSKRTATVDAYNKHTKSLNVLIHKHTQLKTGTTIEFLVEGDAKNQETKHLMRLLEIADQECKALEEGTDTSLKIN
ncbi:hypothetical protein BY458DRAFT_66052 [Sporodiniella umbellata]|nr:hypothetical protein BY458DRAFT_66052 [Sporodiniella umbellata]